MSSLVGKNICALVEKAIIEYHCPITLYSVLSGVTIEAEAGMTMYGQC